MDFKVRIPHIKSPRFLLWFSLFFSIMSETLISMKIIPDSSIVKGIQYVVILIPMGVNCLNLLLQEQRYYKKILFKEELKTILYLVLLLAILSCFKSLSANNFTFESIMQLIQIVLPFLFAYLVINLLKPKQIEGFMKFSLILTIVGYIYETGIETFTLTNFLQMSFFSSYSAFENSTYAEIASGLAAYFIYNRKKTPVFAVLSIILNVLIFKRVLVLMLFMLLIISLMGKEGEYIKKRTLNIVTVAWCSIIFLTYFSYQKEVVSWINSVVRVDLVSFTMSRIYRLWYLYEQGFSSYGLGSTTVFIESRQLSYLGHEMEMDFIRILFELGPIAIIAVVYSYLKITRRNKYAFVLIFMCFVNLWMSNGLVRYWGWTMRIITIALINNYDVRKNNAKLKKQSYRANIKKIRWLNGKNINHNSNL